MGEAEDKAEKLAAAKKKYEQLKKQKAKKGGASKKKDDAESSTPAAAAKEGEDVKAEEAEAVDNEDDDATAGEAADTVESPKKSHGRAPSVSIQSKLRSESFRKESPRSPAGDGDPAFRVEELERDNKRLQGEKEDAEARWKKLEEELQELKEASGDSAGWLKQEGGQADEVEKLKAELTSLQRQNAQLAAAKRRTSASISIPSSTGTSDLQAQLNSKSETISSLELEISTLQSRLSTAQSKTDEQDSRLNTLELDLAKAIHDRESVAQELADLKANLERASERAVADGSARSSAETRIAQLEAELGSSKRATEEASKRASTQEKKVATLTTLHRESDARHQVKLGELGKQERDAKELRARVAALSNENARLTDEAIRRKKLEAAGDSEGLDELEDEERQRLAGRVRELEEEVFELRRGVWREKRMQLQPGMEGLSTSDPYAANTTFSDIDLNSASATSPSAARRAQQNHSSLTDYINSGLSAFRGDPSPQANRRQSIVAGRERGQSLGLMSEDGFEFDEDAFRKAQEDEASRRLERVREVKRGLVEWKGWRVDIADLRGGWGGVFEA